MAAEGPSVGAGVAVGGAVVTAVGSALGAEVGAGVDVVYGARAGGVPNGPNIEYTTDGVDQSCRLWLR